MGTPSQPIVTGRHACTIGLKSLFKVINEYTPESKEARRFFELKKTAYQCKKVLTARTHCWICGGGFESPEPRFAPQCEHVLPVAQGVIFLELYGSRNRDVTPAMELEYEWAHAVCNNAKSSTVLIKGEEANFQPDVDKITALLSTLQYKGVPITENQLSYMISRLKKVTDYINTLPDYSINSGEFCPRKLTFAGRKTFRRKNNGRSVRKATVWRNVATSNTDRKIRASTRKRS
jgi:hypothetical protein